MLLRRSSRVRTFSLASFALVASASSAPYLEQSFFFDWNIPGQPYPIPVTQQCDTIHITWGRAAATGPNPVSPYYLQVYTSAYLVPFIISVGDVLQYDWNVPFAPGTLYQICMFDKNGNTGGCQDVYTVIPSNSSATPSCANVTVPMPLQVDATVANGPLSQYGWIEQCTDISLVPRNGTPPYTMTVAPTLHPPYNITGDGSKPLNWTVSLSWSSSFFISVVDSVGNVWSNGLLHSGGGLSTACLSGQPLQSSSGNISTGVAVGAGVGGLGVGLAAGALGVFAFFHFRNRKHRSTDSLMDLRATSHLGSPQGAYLHAPSAYSHYHAIPTSAGIPIDNSLGLSNHTTSRISSIPANTQYHIEPFVLPAEDGHLRSPTSPIRPNPSNPSLNAPSSLPDTSNRPTSSGRTQNVYVVHHDGGRAPVTVYTQEGAQVVELPPGYPGAGEVGEPLHNPHSHIGHDARSELAAGSSAIGSGSSDTGRTEGSAPGAETPRFLQQVRRPGQAQKPSVSRMTGTHS